MRCVATMACSCLFEALHSAAALHGCWQIIVNLNFDCMTQPHHDFMCRPGGTGGRLPD